MSRINDPEIPGRIMAQMAIAPEKKKAIGLAGVWVGERVAMTYPKRMVMIMVTIFVEVQVLTCLLTI